MWFFFKVKKKTKLKFVILTRALIVIPHNLIGPWCDVITAKHRHSCFCLSRRKCAHLVVPPQPGQAVGVHDAEDFTFWILPADVVLVPAVWQELVDVVPQQPAVCTQTTRVSSHVTHVHLQKFMFILSQSLRDEIRPKDTSHQCVRKYQCTSEISRYISFRDAVLIIHSTVSIIY